MKTVVLAIFSVVTIFCAFAQADQFLGEALVSTGSCRNTEVLLGDVCGYQAVRLDVLNLPMRISGMTITFQNGQSQFVGVTPYITPGTSSGWKTLIEAGLGCLHSIEVTGEAEGGPGSSAELQIFGLL